MKLLFDESLSPKLVLLLRDLFPESESALQNGLARLGDRRILDYAAAHDFILVSTDSDFQSLLKEAPNARVVILRSCDYPTAVAARVLRRNAILHCGVTQFAGSVNYSRPVTWARELVGKRARRLDRGWNG